MDLPFALSPLTPALGAEITGVDLTSDLDDTTLSAIDQAFLDHHVLVFRGQPLTPEAHKAFARRYGDLHVHPSRRRPDFRGDPEIFTVRADENTVLNNGGLWHADVTCDEIPPLGSMLRLIESPRVGGDTLFANMHLVYEQLSKPMQAMLRGLHAEHDQRHDVARYGIDVPADVELPCTVHPVVVDHPVTGRPLLFVNRAFTTRLVELTAAESATLLEFLFERIATSVDTHCRVQWQPDTLVFWDNRCTQHHAVWDYRPERRSGERVTIVATSRPSQTG